jgi:hypothetical protein
VYLHGAVPGTEQQTAVAASADGVHFAPLTPDPILPHPYLRIWRRKDAYYGVCRFGNNLGLVRSADGIAWTESQRPLLTTGDEYGEYDRLRHHCVRVIGDEVHLYYCTYRDPELKVEAIRLAVIRMRGDWSTWRAERAGDALTPKLDWECGNLRDPYVIETEGRLYMFYVGGNEAGIGLAAL